MAKSNRTNRNRSNKRIQVIYSEPKKIFKERYLSPKGKMLLKTGQITKEEAWNWYGKNRYTSNPNAKPVGSITHNI